MTDQLAKENAQLTQNINGLVAQLDAHKQMLNENLQGNLNLRTQIIMFQKANQELSNRVAELEKQLSTPNETAPANDVIEDAA